MRRTAGAVEALAGAAALLDVLAAAGVRVGVVTNAPREMMEHTLGEAALRDRFPIVIVGEECARAKPFPDPYVDGCRALDVRPREVRGAPCGGAGGMRVGGRRGARAGEPRRAVGGRPLAEWAARLRGVARVAWMKEGAGGGARTGGTGRPPPPPLVRDPRGRARGPDAPHPSAGAVPPRLGRAPRTSPLLDARPLPLRTPHPASRRRSQPACSRLASRRATRRRRSSPPAPRLSSATTMTSGSRRCSGCGWARAPGRRCSAPPPSDARGNGGVSVRRGGRAPSARHPALLLAAGACVPLFGGSQSCFVCPRGGPSCAPPRSVWHARGDGAAGVFILPHLPGTTSPPPPRPSWYAAQSAAARRTPGRSTSAYNT